MAVFEPITPAKLERSASNDRAQTRAELHLRIQYAVAQILSEARSETEAWSQLLAAICTNLEWNWGAFWRRYGDRLRMVQCWSSDPRLTEGFAETSRALEFVEGEGLPGRAWREGRPIWMNDFSRENEMPRGVAAARCRLHAALSFPVSGREFVGVIEFFNDEVLELDPELAQMMSAVGAQIGQFLERREAEQALAESQSLFRGIFEGAQDAILLTSDSGQYIEANPAALNLFGYSRRELLGKHVWEIVPTGQEEAARTRWEEFLQGRRLVGEFTARRSDGTNFEVEYRSTARIIPGIHLSVLREVTERKTREQWTRMLAQAGVILADGLNYRTTLKRVARLAVPEFADWCLVDILSEDGRIERLEAAHVDPQVEAKAAELLCHFPINPKREFGSPNVIRTGEPELININDDILRAVAGDTDRALVAQGLKLRTSLVVPLKAQGKPFGALSFLRSHPRAAFGAGDVEIAQEVARRAGWALDNARLYEAARQELKLREQVEEELKKLNYELEARIEERTAALQESHSQMEAFCYSVSHDLRAPLRSMQGFSHALVEDHAPNLNEEGRDFARRILVAAEHMDSLLADVLAYSRLSRQELKPEPVELALVLNEVIAQLQSEIRARKAKVNVGACQARVLANASVLELMLVNLLENALKFMPSGRTPSVSIEIEEIGIRCRIYVRDNGIGIAPEHHQRIFRIFERLHGVETYPGTGIGLALVLKAAERMNGSVGLESAVGEGTSFWIELPK
jgi:PAS domain S-box-containing protein